jgi:hypothetical protein
MVPESVSDMRSRTYMFEVEGELSSELRPVFGAMRLRHQAGNTVIEGLVRDQSELYGLLLRALDLGLTLLRLEAVE